MTGFALKLIAFITMILDHTAVAISPFWPVSIFGMHYSILNIIGRISFPVYAFLITEGVLHTSDWKRYAKRLFLLALVSELCFDFAFYHRINLYHQNVFFTLLLGMLSVQADLFGRAKGNYYNGIIALVVCCLTAIALKTDYSAIGVLMIYLCYQTKDRKEIMAVGMILLNAAFGIVIQMFALFALIPICLYNGKQGLKNKWIQHAFYWAYPMHLLILYGIWHITFSG